MVYQKKYHWIGVHSGNKHSSDNKSKDTCAVYRYCSVHVQNLRFQCLVILCNDKQYMLLQINIQTQQDLANNTTCKLISQKLSTL